MEKNKQVLLVFNFGFNTFVGNKEDFKKHFPSRTPTWLDFDFEITDSIQKRTRSEYDFIVFYGENHWSKEALYQPFNFINEIFRIKYQAVLYIGIESTAVVDYNRVYKKLFEQWPYHNFHVFLIQKDFSFPKLHIAPNIAVTWHSVVDDETNSLDYDFFLKNSPKKTKDLAIISSNATYANGHRLRIEFSHKIKELFKDKIDFYGRGFNSFKNKYHTLSEYKYLIIMENGVCENYWTEKIADCYIAEAYPIYYGCPNIDDFFDKNALTLIDIEDFDSSVKTIKKVISKDLFATKYEEIKKAKNLILNEFNFFNMVRKFCLESM